MHRILDIEHVPLLGTGIDVFLLIWQVMEVAPMTSTEDSTSLLDEDGLAARFLCIEREQTVRLNELTFHEPVQYVYNPLDYAWEPHEDYVQRYCQSHKEILFLGMNPGPFGMAQTGVSRQANLGRKFNP